ncbi:MAG: SpoIIE family protein phosphatase [Pseudomonadota bacterium]
MKIKLKFFLTFLAISLAPLLAVTIVNQASSRKMEKILIQDVRRDPAGTSPKELELTMENHALEFLKVKSILELTLGFLSGPAGAAPNEPGSRDALLAAANKIAGMFPPHALIIRIRLESGETFAFPEASPTPGPRDVLPAEWYESSRVNLAPTWSGPEADPELRASLALTVPLRGPDGVFHGAAAAEVPLGLFFADRPGPPLADPDRDSWVAFPDQSAPSTPPRFASVPLAALLFLAKGSPPVAPAAPGSPLPDQATLARLFSSPREPHGMLDYVRDGEEFHLAFARLPGRALLATIIPPGSVESSPEPFRRKLLTLIDSQRLTAVYAAIIAIVLVALLSYLAAAAALRPFLQLVAGSRRIAEGDFSVRMESGWKDERDMVCQCFNQMAPKLEEHLRMRQSLGLAQEVQQSLLPQEDPRIPGFDIAGKSVYCDETGGDYYDYFPLGSQAHPKLAVVVGDVSGHGVSSALLMAAARALIRQGAVVSTSMAELIEGVNLGLTRDAYSTGQFMTLFYLEIEYQSRRISWVRAGHDPAWLHDPESDSFRELDGQGIALGLDENFEFSASELELKPGQIIVIGTDGIWEMKNGEGRMFGKAKFLEVIRAARDLPAQGIISAVLEALGEHRGAREPEDDVTMVVIKATPPRADG